MVHVKPLIIELAEVIPAAELDDAWPSPVLVIGIVGFGEQQRRIIKAELKTVLVALTWVEILGARPDWVVVVDGRHELEAIIWAHADEDARRSNRIDGAPKRKVVRTQRGPAEGRGNESAGAVGEHELSVGSQQAE